MVQGPSHFNFKVAQTTTTKPFTHYGRLAEQNFVQLRPLKHNARGLLNFLNFRYSESNKARAPSNLRHPLHAAIHGRLAWASCFDDVLLAPRRHATVWFARHVRWVIAQQYRCQGPNGEKSPFFCQQQDGGISVVSDLGWLYFFLCWIIGPDILSI